MNAEITKIINQLNLQPHPEGGYFKETYRSEGVINKSNLGIEFSGARNYATAIYFLLTSDTFSAFHRIKQDEIWHFHKGSPIKLHIISAKGDYTNVIIGNNLEHDELPQYVVKANDWFAAEVIENNKYSLLGCTVSPGFDFKDFELAKEKALSKMYPQHQNIISRLTRE